MNTSNQKKNKLTRLALVAGVSLLVPQLAQADCFTQPLPWTVRLGSHNIDPVGGTSHTAAGDIEVKSKVGVTFNVDYRICQHISIDLLAALPYTQGIKLNGDRVAATQHLPPTLSLQYHLLPDAALDPFVGIGVNRTLFFREELPGAKLQLSNTWGVAAQAGLDWHFAKAWQLGVDLRYIQIEPNASVDGTPIGKVKIDPIAYGVNLGYRF